MNTSYQRSDSLVTEMLSRTSPHPIMLKDEIARRLYQTAADYPVEGELKTATKRAAVLCLLGLDGGGLHLLLTRRADNLRLHAGQVSLPGGKPEPDDEDAAQTALRESREEIGLRPEDVQILGYSPPVLTSTRYLVDVCVGMALQTPAQLMTKLSPCDDEVSDVWFGHAADLCDLSRFERHQKETDEGRRHYYSITGTDPLVWGATAAIIRNLVLHLSQR